MRIKNQSGDTMVEVLASIAIVGLALAGGYALSSHSLRTGIDASQRSAAVSLAQGQVEFLKNSVVEGTTAQYMTSPGTDFCIRDTDGARLSGSQCVGLSGSAFDMFIRYSGDPNRVFTIEPRWNTFRSTERNKLTLYYKLPSPYP